MSVLMPPRICQECVREDVAAIVNEEDGLKMHLRWGEGCCFRGRWRQS
jgi:hypothetical protein